jgi:hypothetical protein
MKKIFYVVLALLFAFGVSYAKDLEVKKKAGQYDVEVKMDKNPPIVGENGIKVEIKDPSGKYVTDAKVVIEYSMPPMPGMPAMNYKTEAKLEGKEYKAKMNLSMSGAWNIGVKITKDGSTQSVKFNVDAR